LAEKSKPATSRLFYGYANRSFIHLNNVNPELICLELQEPGSDPAVSGYCLLS